MGESVFEWTAGSLNNNDQGYIHFLHHIDIGEYESWLKFFTWDALRSEQRYGQSFCQHFEIRDNLLYYERDQGRADVYIRRNYLARP
jgi:hypothetical protein